MSTIKKILVIKLRAIGDVVMSSVVIPNIRAAYPDAQIDFLTQDFCRDAMSGHELLNELVVFERKAQAGLPFYRQWMMDFAFLKRIHRQRYDLVFDFFGNPRTAMISLFSHAPRRVGYDYRLRRYAYTVQVRSRADELHEVDWHLDALEAVGIPVVSRSLSFPLTDSAHCFAKDFFRCSGLDTKPVFGLNFSGGWPAKQWPLKKFSALAGELVSAFGVHVCIIWGPGELEQAERCAAASPVPVTLIPETDLKQLGAILSRLTLLVSTDSGPMHIAAALQVPCVGIFGPTHPDRQGPYGDQHVVVQKKDLDCLGCNRRDCDHRSCMHNLTVADVMTGVQDCVDKNRFFFKD